MQSVLARIGDTPLARLEPVGCDLPLSGPVSTVMCDGWDRYLAKPWMQSWEHA